MAKPIFSRVISPSLALLLGLAALLLAPVGPTRASPQANGETPPAFLLKWGSSGSGAGQFGEGAFGAALGVAVDPSGNVYVSDSFNHRIQKFSSSGAFLNKWGSGGSGDGQFLSPSGVAVDGQGRVYVADFGNHRIQKFSSEGAFITKWGSFGQGGGQFDSLRGVAADSHGTVYVADGGAGDHEKTKASRSSPRRGPLSPNGAPRAVATAFSIIPLGWR